MGKTPPKTQTPDAIGAFCPKTRGAFTEGGTANLVDISKSPRAVEPPNYNGDPLPFSFRPAQYTSAGERRKGIAMRVAGATSVDDRI